MRGMFRTIFQYREKETQDILGRYPEFLHVSAMPERRYLWTSRVLVILACISISFTMILSSLIYILLPQRSADPRFFVINRYFSVLELVQPDEIYMPATNLVIENYINDYIMYRYIVTQDYDELMNRWDKGGSIYMYSSSLVFQQFTDNDAKLNIMQFREKQIQRDVEVDWVRPMGVGLWQVQFRTMDYLPYNMVPDTNIWRAVMRVAFFRLGKDVKNKNVLILNPYGFRVMNYSLGYMGKPGSPASYMEHIKERTEDYYRRY